MIVTNDKGREFYIRVVMLGDRYGLNDCLTHPDRPTALKEPMIEFYDRTYLEKFAPRGQFVSRYYASTLAERGRGGLCLDGGEPAWSVDAAAMAPVYTLAKRLMGLSQDEEEMGAKMRAGFAAEER